LRTVNKLLKTFILKSQSKKRHTGITIKTLPFQNKFSKEFFTSTVQKLFNIKFLKFKQVIHLETFTDLRSMTVNATAHGADPAQLCIPCQGAPAWALAVGLTDAG
jgi:hypothetical protein